MSLLLLFRNAGGPPAGLTGEASSAHELEPVGSASATHPVTGAAADVAELAPQGSAAATHPVTGAATGVGISSHGTGAAAGALAGIATGDAATSPAGSAAAGAAIAGTGRSDDRAFPAGTAGATSRVAGTAGGTGTSVDGSASGELLPLPPPPIAGTAASADDGAPAGSAAAALAIGGSASGDGSTIDGTASAVMGRIGAAASADELQPGASGAGLRSIGGSASSADELSIDGTADGAIADAPRLVASGSGARRLNVTIEESDAHRQAGKDARQRDARAAQELEHRETVDAIERGRGESVSAKQIATDRRLPWSRQPLTDAWLEELRDMERRVAADRAARAVATPPPTADRTREPADASQPAATDHRAQDPAADRTTTTAAHLAAADALLREVAERQARLDALELDELLAVIAAYA